MANLGLKVYESFFTLMDTDLEDRKITLDENTWYAQIFLSKTTSLPNIFFMADIDSGYESNLTVEIASVTVSGTTFTPDSTLATVTADDLEVVGRNVVEDEAAGDIYWYTYNCNLTITEGVYYAIIFKSTSSKVSLYYSQKYRDEIFPSVVVSTSTTSPDWSNDNFTQGIQAFGEGRLGGLCCGYLGNDVSDGIVQYDSGDVILGGSDSRRGYATYLYVVKTNDDVKISFSMSSPTSSTYGSPEEANRSYMTYFWCKEGTLPISDDESLFYNTSIKSRLSGSDTFVLYTQPEKFAPYPKIYYPENAVTLDSSSVGVNVLYEGYDVHEIQSEEDGIYNTSDNMSLEKWAHFAEKTNAAYLSTDRKPSTSVNPSYVDFTTEKKNRDIEKIAEMNMDIKEDSFYMLRGFNNVVKYRDYLISFGKYLTSDFYREIYDNVYSFGSITALAGETGEDGGVGYYKILQELGSTFSAESIAAYEASVALNGAIMVITNTSNNMDGVYDIITTTTGDPGEYPFCVAPYGFTGSEAQLPKTNIYGDDIRVQVRIKTSIFEYLPSGDASSFYISRASSSNESLWSLTTASITDLSEFLSSYSAGNTKIVGVYDACVKNTASGETLFVLFQAIPVENSDKPYFFLGYTSDAPSGTMTFSIPYINNAEEHDARFNINFDTSTYSDVYGYGYQYDQDFNKDSSVDYYDYLMYTIDDVDYQGAKFVASPDDDYLLFTARNYGYKGKFGLWKVDLTAESGGELLLNDVDLLYRGFDESYENEPEITAVYDDTDNTNSIMESAIFYGVCTKGNKDISGVEDGLIGHVYVMDKNFLVENVLKGDRDQLWLAGYTDEHSWGTGHYNKLKGSSKVSFIQNVSNILHVWVSPMDEELGNPFHIAKNLKTGVIRVLRRFPFPDGDTNDPVYDETIDGLVATDKSKYIERITSGSVMGNHIFITGIGANGNGYNVPKCIVYDKRTINHAFDYYDNADYDIYGSGDLLQGVYDLKINSSDPSLKYGVYTGTTISKYDYYKNSETFNDYPALLVTDDNPRIGIYCGCVRYINDSVWWFCNNQYDDNIRIYAQNGAAFIICDNDDEGYNVYKTYGLKQLPNEWGISDKEGGPGADGATVNYNIDPETLSNGSPYLKEVYIPDKKSRRVWVSNVEGIHYITSLKRNDSFVDANDYVDPSDNIKVIQRISTGYTKPQNMSFYYKFNYLRAAIDSTKEIDGEDATSTVIAALKNPSNTSMVLKYAETWEDLYYNPSGTVSIPLAFDTSSTPEQTRKALFHYTFQTDVNPIFYRLESKSIICPTDTNFQFDSPYAITEYSSAIDPFAEILIKGLRFNNVNLGYEDTQGNKNISITGLVKSSDPKEILNNGVTLKSGDEIIVDFPTHIFINEISFNAKVKLLSGGDYSSFTFSYIPRSSKNIYSEDLITDDDWVDLGTVEFDPSDYTTSDLKSGVPIKKDSIRLFIKTLKISLNSGNEIEVNNFGIKSFITNTSDLDNPTDTQFTKYGRVSNPELLIVDDVNGLINGISTGNQSAASFASFKSDNSYVIMDLGKLRDDDGVLVDTGDIPVNRITASVVNSYSRSIKIEIQENGSAVWETVYDDLMLEYEYSLVTWTSRSTVKSNIVDVDIVDEVESIDPYGNSNTSLSFESGVLRDWVFRPNINRARNITIIDNEPGTSNDGVLTFDAQMDGNGPFSSDVGETGVIERTLNIDFPVRNVRRIKLTVYGFEDGNSEIPVRINGLKVYTPIVNSDGTAVWPKTNVYWNINFRTTAI